MILERFSLLKEKNYNQIKVLLRTIVSNHMESTLNQEDKVFLFPLLSTPKQVQRIVTYLTECWIL